MLRDHEILNSPLKVDRAGLNRVPTPGAWTREIKNSEVEVLPLVTDVEATYPDGWCVYTYEHTQAPEMEIICGGVNGKSPMASAIWRQGFLLHFGFEPAPSQMNENGKALLINSIVYIAGFRDDRPLVRTPGPHYSRVRLLDRTAIERLVENDSRELDVYLDYFLAPSTRVATKDMTRPEVAKWYSENRSFLRADEEGNFIIDEEAREFGVPTDQHEFYESAITAIRSESDKAGLARILLQRYVPNGPGNAAKSDEWTEWYRENKEYLFFTDTGGFRWMIDALAKRRGIPSAKLCGPMRRSSD